MFEESTGRHELRVREGVQALSDAGISVEPQQLGDAIRTVGRETSADHDRGFDRTFTERMQQILDAADLDARASINNEQFEAFSRAIDEPFLVHSPTIYPAAQSVLSAIREMGVRTALISNVGSTSPGVYRRYLEREGVGQYLEYLTFSNEIASAKPAAKMFTHTLEQLGVAPENALHVGDNLHADVGGAKDVGMSAVWVRGYDDRKPRVQPDFTISGLDELPAVVERWLIS
jgi:FMN phosphatase YigB (HAD superfamily)